VSQSRSNLNFFSKFRFIFDYDFCKFTSYRTCSAWWRWKMVLGRIYRGYILFTIIWKLNSSAQKKIITKKKKAHQQLQTNVPICWFSSFLFLFLDYSNIVTVTLFWSWIRSLILTRIRCERIVVRNRIVFRIRWKFFDVRCWQNSCRARNSISK